jgi:ferredoxin
MDVCPVKAIDMTPPPRASIEGGIDKKIWMTEFPILTGRCIGCKICVAECPFDAITLVKDSEIKQEKILKKDVSDIFDRAKKMRKSSTTSLSEEKDWRSFHPLSELTRDILKRPVRSSFPQKIVFKPWISPIAVSANKKKYTYKEQWKVWRIMKSDK